MDFAQFIPPTVCTQSGRSQSLQYQAILKETTTTVAPPKRRPKIAPRRNPAPQRQIDFNANTFFRAATASDLTTLRSMRLTSASDINTLDSFGWSALMMAACAGALPVVEHLLQQPDIDVAITDKQGRCALSLAADHGHASVLRRLRSHLEAQLEATIKTEDAAAAIVISDSDDDAEPPPTPTTSNASFFCRDCDRSFNARETRRQHNTSILHRFNIRDQLPALSKRYHLPDSNRGFRLMLKQGWDRESGLGTADRPDGQGISFPLKTTLRTGRSGLGMPQPAARITHFDAHDEHAVQGGRKPRPMVVVPTRRSMRRDDARRRRRERRLRETLS